MSSKANVVDQELTAGQMLGRYELLMPIAKGGMGNVWAARLKGTRGFRKLVAIKTILRSLEHVGLEQMLFQEAVLASQIQHPNVAETLELGEHDGKLYLVMELVSGESLRNVLREAHAHGGIPVPVCINVIGQVCRGLAAAHDLRDENGEPVGLVHRDISPPNIMITDAGTVKIIDFGVATTAAAGGDAAGEIKGKLSYLAPEQLRGEVVDARVDVFATGILLYLLTVGSHPFRTTSESGTIARILSEAPAVAPSALIEDYPRELERIVMQALHKDREQRFPSINALLEALQNAFPEAFGPRPDQAAALCLQNLMKERALERKATLRLAEELAEKSVSAHGAYSVPVLTVSSAPLVNAHRAALLGMGGLIAGLGAAALAGSLYLQGLRPAGLHSAAALTPAVLALPTAHSAPAVAREATAAVASSAVTPEPAALPAALITSNKARSKRARSGHPTRGEQPDLASEPATVEGFSSSAVVKPPVEAALATAEPTPHANEPEPPRVPDPQTPAAFAPPAPAKAASIAPRFVSSRLGQAQLLTNPSSFPSRVRLPAALSGSGETFSAVVNICVSATGSVSRVDIIRSAGPALDPQIPNALSHWRYRPLLDAGKPTPFCYRLNYEIHAR